MCLCNNVYSWHLCPVYVHRLNSCSNEIHLSNLAHDILAAGPACISKTIWIQIIILRGFCYIRKGYINRLCFYKNCISNDRLQQWKNVDERNIKNGIISEVIWETTAYGGTKRAGSDQIRHILCGI